MKLQDKTILITGASSGIGKAMALRAAGDGGTVILSSLHDDGLLEVKKEVEAKGANAIAIHADVTKTEDIRNLFLKATEGGREIDVVFNNAGLGFVAPIHELTTDQIEKMMDVNAKGMILVSKFASEVMTRQEHGHLIMTSSLAGLITLPNWSVYCASKWAITGFADAIRPEMKKFNVKVTTLHPGLVKTDFFAKDKANLDIEEEAGGSEVLMPEDVAEAAYEAIFTDTEKIKIPAMAKQFSFMYKYLPFLVKGQLEKMAEDTNTKVREEDEPGFSMVRDS